MCGALSCKATARYLGITVRRVKNVWTSIYSKLNINGMNPNYKKAEKEEAA